MTHDDLSALRTIAEHLAERSGYHDSARCDRAGRPHPGHCYPPAGSEPDFIVIRAHPDLPPGWLPPNLDGRWLDRRDIPTRRDGHLPNRPVAFAASVAVTAVATGRFEFREYDGAVAEVYEVRP